MDPQQEAKDNRKRALDQTKRLATSNAALTNDGSDTSAKVPHKKKARTGVIPPHNQQVRKNPKHKGFQHYCVLYKNYGMPDCKYKSHSS